MTGNWVSCKLAVMVRERPPDGRQRRLFLLRLCQTPAGWEPHSLSPPGHHLSPITGHRISLHPHPNAKTPRVTVCLDFAKAKSQVWHLIMINSQTRILTRTRTGRWSSTPGHVRPSSPSSSFSGIKDSLMDTSVGPVWQQLLAGTEDWSGGGMFKPGAEVRQNKDLSECVKTCSVVQTIFCQH